MENENKPQFDERLSLKFAELAKREKALRDLEAQVRAQKEETSKMYEEVTKRKQMDGLKAENPLKWLEAEGVKYEHLTDALAQSEEHKDGLVIKDMRDQINSLKQMMTELTTQYKTDKEQQQVAIKTAEETNEQYAKKNYIESIKKMAEMDKDKYEVVNAFWETGKVDELIVEVQNLYYEKTGKLLEPDEVLMNVNSTLANEAKQGYSKVKGLKSIWGEEPDELPLSDFQKEDGTELPNWLKPKKTLNKDMAHSSGTTSDPNKYLSREDSIAMIADKYSKQYNGR